MYNIICFKTKIGWISVEEKNNKIYRILIKKSNNINKSLKLKKIKSNIMNYLSKKSKKINANLELNGTKLQKKIWFELTKIPYGKTKSYGEIAKKVKTSPRYVGNVCGQNQHLLAIPCHRVIRGDGDLGGFSGAGGIKTKRKLLELELIQK